MMPVSEVVAFSSMLSSDATAIGVTVVGRQLMVSKHLARTAFEDQLHARYREIIHQLPISVLLGDALADYEYVAALLVLYQYIDLSNEQVYLNTCGRISPQTWANWREGIAGDFSLPTFQRASSEIGARAPRSFDYLRRISAPQQQPPHLVSVTSGPPNLNRLGGARRTNSQCARGDFLALSTSRQSARMSKNNAA